MCSEKQKYNSENLSELIPQRPGTLLPGVCMAAVLIGWV